MDKLRPVEASCWRRCRPFFESTGAGKPERSLATDILADYAADQPQVLADLLMDADEKQFAVIYPKFKDRGEQGLSPADRRNRQEAAARPALLGREAGEAGEAAGECGGGPAEDEPAREGLAAVEAQPRSKRCGAI